MVKAIAYGAGLAVIVCAFVWVISKRDDVVPLGHQTPAPVPATGVMIESSADIGVSTPRPVADDAVEEAPSLPSVPVPPVGASTVTPLEVSDAVALASVADVDEAAAEPIRGDAELPDNPDAWQPPKGQGSCEGSVSPDGYVYADTTEMVDVMPDQVIWYAVMDRNPANLLMLIRAALDTYACDMVEWSDDALVPAYQLVLLGPTADAVVYLGESWLGDGTRVVPIDPADYQWLSEFLEMRRSQPGPKMSRAEFDAYWTQRQQTYAAQ